MGKAVYRGGVDVTMTKLRSFLRDCVLTVELFFVLAFWCFVFASVYLVLGAGMLVERIFAGKSGL